MKEKLLCLFALFLPLEQIFLFVFNVDTQLKPYRIFILLTFFLMIFSKKTLTKSRTSHVFFGLFFIFIYGFSVGLIRIGINEGNIDYLLNGSIHFIIGLMTFYVFSNIQDSKLLYKIGIYFIIGIAISSIYGLYSLFFLDFTYFRLRGFFNNPNHLAIVINLISPFLIYNYIIGRRKKTMLFAFIFFTVIVFLTASRTGVILQTINLLYLLYTYKTKILNLFIFSITAVVAYFWAVVPALNKNSSILDRFEESNFRGAGGRFDILNSVINLGVDSYFTGVGIQQYRFHHTTYAKSAEIQSILDYELGTHNHYLDLLVNFGVLSFTIYIFFLLKILRSIHKIDENNLRKSCYLFFLIFLLACSSQEMFMWPLFWACLSLLIVSTKNINGYSNPKS